VWKQLHFQVERSIDLDHLTFAAAAFAFPSGNSEQRKADLPKAFANSG
jgi:hypothetical protein